MIDPFIGQFAELLAWLDRFGSNLPDCPIEEDWPEEKAHAAMAARAADPGIPCATSCGRFSRSSLHWVNGGKWLDLCPHCRHRFKL